MIKFAVMGLADTPPGLFCGSCTGLMLILMRGIFDERETACFYCPAAAEKRIYMRTILAVAVFEDIAARRH
jgi:hypothetical protein